MRFWGLIMLMLKNDIEVDILDPFILNFDQSSKLIIFNQIALTRCNVNLI